MCKRIGARAHEQLGEIAPIPDADNAHAAARFQLGVEAGYAEFRNELRPKPTRLKPSVMLAFPAELRLS